MAGQIRKVYTFYIENALPEIISFQPRSKPHDPDKAGQNSTVTNQELPNSDTPLNEVSDNTTQGNRSGSGEGKLKSTLYSAVTGGVVEESGAIVQNLSTEESRAEIENNTTVGDNQFQDDELNAIEADLEVMLEPNLRRGQNISMVNVGKKFSGRYLIDSMLVKIDESGATSFFQLKKPQQVLQNLRRKLQTVGRKATLIQRTTQEK